MIQRQLAITAICVADAACSDTMTSPGIQSDQPTASLARSAQIAMCHLDGDLGEYLPIVVNGNAEAAHRAHGDGQVGDRLPGRAIYVLFDQNCAPVEDGHALVGTITASITRGGTPSGTDRGVESAAVNLVAGAQLWTTQANGAQIAFMNP